MSKFYIIGTNSEILQNNNFSFEPFEISQLKFSDTNKENLNEKYYYLLKCEYLGYDIKNLYDFDNNPNRIYFFKFIKFIKEILYSNTYVSFFQFWDANSLVIEENNIYQTRNLTTNEYDYAEDYFQFEFNTKYIFKNKD